PDGTGLVYCGYIGGAAADLNNPGGLAVDAAGAAYVTGQTGSSETSFPVLVGPDLTYNGGTDAFAAKVLPDGTGLEYCGYIGGAGMDAGGPIALDSVGAIYIAGSTSS